MNTKTFTLKQLRDMPVGAWYEVVSFDGAPARGVIEILESGELLYGRLDADGVLVEDILSYDPDETLVELAA